MCAERVDIMVVATDGASQIFRGITSQLGEFGSIVQSITGGRGLEELTGQVIKFGKESIDAFTEGAQAAHQLAQVSGTSIEDASRFIQVLDDFGLKQDAALVATRALTKQGLEPSIDTLAKLSDQYKAIKDPQERNEFILRNLGRAGLEWAKVLDQGSVSLKRHAESISENLIFTDEMYQRAEKLRIAQDDLNDTWEAAKIRIGEQLVPALSGLLDFTNKYNAAQEDEVRGWERLIVPVGMAHGLFIAIRESISGTKDATNEMAGANDALANSTQKTTEELKAEQEAAKELTKTNQDYLSMVGDLTGKLQDYDQKHQEIQNQLNSGKITLGEAQKAWKALADEQEEASRRMILSMLQQRLSADGLTTAEMQYLLQLGLQWGVYSQSAVTEANKALAKVDELAGAFQQIPAQTTSVINVITNYQQIGAPSISGGTAYGGSNTGHHHASGGLFQIPEFYGNEGFQLGNYDTASGGELINITPKGSNPTNGFTFVYSPQVSLGTSSEVRNVIAPEIEKIIRRMQSDGRVAL